ncbi:MAG: carbohydrate ABC transporter permease [Eubacteriales bacterium]
MAKVGSAIKNFFVEKFWRTFCVAWIWRTFCVKWVWQGFCVNLVYKKFDKWKAWLYLAPAIILLCIFTVWPIINTVHMAFLEGYSGMRAAGGEVFTVGFRNFTKVVGNSQFKQSLANTLLLCVLTVPISTFLALLIAVCLNSIKPLQKFLQTIFFLPYVTNSIAIGMVFAAMFKMVGSIGIINESITTPGIVNNILGLFGIGPINWINQGSTHFNNMVVMVIYIVWNALPFKILVLLGGLQSVNRQYYDAAKVDGTSRMRIFGRITVPLLSPMLAYVVITGFIGGFKEYTSIVGIFGSNMGPAGDQRKTMNTIVGLIYDSLSNNQQGTASAAALILFGIILVVTLINLWVSKKRVHY